jgi:hypothetical protein
VVLVIGCERSKSGEEKRPRAELRRELIEQLRTGDGLDAAAAYEVREQGWMH